MKSQLPTRSPGCSVDPVPNSRARWNHAGFKLRHPRRAFPAPDDPIFQKMEVGPAIADPTDLNLNLLVELVGLEPTTSCMPCKRSPN